MVTQTKKPDKATTEKKTLILKNSTQRIFKILVLEIKFPYIFYTQLDKTETKEKKTL